MTKQNIYYKVKKLINKNKIIIIIYGIMLMCNNVFAEELNDTKTVTNGNISLDNITESIKYKLSNTFKNSNFEKIFPTEVENIFAIKFKDKIIYTTKDAQYLIFGEIYNINGQNLTNEKHKQQVSYQDFFDSSKYFTPFIFNPNGAKKIIIYELFEISTIKSSVLYYLLNDKNFIKENSNVSIQVYPIPVSNSDENLLSYNINNFRNMKKLSLMLPKSTNSSKNNQNSFRYLIYKTSLKTMMDRLNVDFENYRYAYIYNDNVYTAETLLQMINKIKEINNE